MSLAHFDDISDICYEPEKDQLFGKKFRLEDVLIKKHVLKSSDLSKNEISKELFIV